jgi:transposase
MIRSGVEIFVALSPIDLRWGCDRLSGLVDEQLGRTTRSGALFVFFGKRRSALKILSTMAAACACSTSVWMLARFAHLQVRLAIRRAW